MVNFETISLDRTLTLKKNTSGGGTKVKVEGSGRQQFRISFNYTQSCLKKWISLEKSSLGSAVDSIAVRDPGQQSTVVVPDPPPQHMRRQRHLPQHMCRQPEGSHQLSKSVVLVIFQMLSVDFSPCLEGCVGFCHCLCCCCSFEM